MTAYWRRLLGNMTAALDYAVLKRYEISLSTLWPRLLHVVADDVRERVEDANIYLDFILMMSFLSVATSGVALTTVAIGPDRSRTLQALLVVLPLFGWWVFYLLAMGATRAFADHVRAAVDLFRLDLLDALSIERPDTPTDEQPIWRAIDGFIIQGDVPGPSVRFVKGNEPPPQPSSGLLDLLGDLWRAARWRMM
jgi:hypothetical protein